MAQGVFVIETGIIVLRANSGTQVPKKINGLGEPVTCVPASQNSFRSTISRLGFGGSAVIIREGHNPGGGTRIHRQVALL